MRLLTAFIKYRNWETQFFTQTRFIWKITALLLVRRAMDDTASDVSSVLGKRRLNVSEILYDRLEGWSIFKNVEMMK